MDTVLLKQFRQLFKKNKIHQNKKIIIFFFFVLVSTGLWFLQTLSRFHTSVVLYPIRFTNFPDNKILVRELPSYLELKISAQGFTLLRYQFKPALIPINIDLNSLLESVFPGEKPLQFYLLTGSKDIEEQINRELNQQIKIIKIKPDTLFFHFENISGKKVPVVPNIKIDFEKQYMMKGKIKVFPDSVNIFGSQKNLIGIHSIQTLPLIFRDVKENITELSELEGIKDVTCPVKNVEVQISAEKYTESHCNITVTVENAPENTTVRIFPDQITVVYKVGFSDYKKVNPQNFSAVVDFLNVQNNKLRIRLVRYPGFLYSLTFHPKMVDYIIEK